MVVRSIVIPHDPVHAPRLRELADIGDLQAAVDGWIEPLEMPALGVTLYVNEAARRDLAPINCRAMALWWLYTADPTQYPMILGDVVLTGNGSDEDTGDVPERIVRDIFGTQEFVLQAKPFGVGPWRDTYARFGNVFDAATWCMLFTYCLRPGAHFRLRSHAEESEHRGGALRGGDGRW